MKLAGVLTLLACWVIFQSVKWFGSVRPGLGHGYQQTTEVNTSRTEQNFNDTFYAPAIKEGYIVLGGGGGGGACHTIVCVRAINFNAGHKFELLYLVLKQPLSKRRRKLVFKTDYQVKSIAKCAKGSILQYLQPSLSYHLSLRSWFVYF